MILFGVTWMLSFPLKSLPQQIGPIYSQTEIKKLTNHVDAVRLERDGDVNINVHKDVIIGDVKEGPQYEDPKTLLENIFKKYVLLVIVSVSLAVMLFFGKVRDLLHLCHE